VVLVRDFFSETLLTEQADRLSLAWPDFDRAGFLGYIKPTLTTLEFKQRSDLILEGLLKFLPQDFCVAQPILLGSLPSKIEGKEIDGYGGFMCLPLGDYVAVRGIDCFELSMEALYHLTQCFTAESSIRPFLVARQTKTLDRLTQWTQDPSVHVRRLVSEGTRPRLPWAFQLKGFVADPSPTLKLLALLINDPELYVRRSVANHLNDISKDHPDLVVDWLAAQMGQGGANFMWVVRHSLRTLIKKQHPGALGLLGFSVCPEVKLSDLKLSSPHITIGEDLGFSCQITSTSEQDQRLAIDFVVDYLKANGALSPKVFKWTVKTLRPGETLVLDKKISLQQRSTRKLYPGGHQISVQIGSLRGPRQPFTLESHGC